MKDFIRFGLLGACLISLGGCVSREQADQKIAKGCEAGVVSLFEGDKKLEKVLETSFTRPAEGMGFRQVTVKATTIEYGSAVDQEYECVFEEHFGPLNVTYSASLYRIKTGNDAYGMVDGEIIGGADVFMKLTDAVRQSMYTNTGEKQ